MTYFRKLYFIQINHFRRRQLHLRMHLNPVLIEHPHRANHLVALLQQLHGAQQLAVDINKQAGLVG
jgi:hypothetical protein